MERLRYCLRKMCRANPYPKPICFVDVQSLDCYSQGVTCKLYADIFLFIICSLLIGSAFRDGATRKAISPVKSATRLGFLSSY